MNAWYQTLKKPPLTPPDWVFSPVWTLLYATIAVSIFLFYKTPGKKDVWFVTSLVIFHLAANFSWTYLFFGLRSPLLALVDIVFMDATLVLIILLFWRVNPLSGALLLPYLVWISFATYLNAGFLTLN